MTTAWRRFVCARCRYYGQKCSTLLGIMTARMMPRDEGKALGPILFMWLPAPPRA